MLSLKAFKGVSTPVSESRDFGPGQKPEPYVVPCGKKRKTTLREAACANATFSSSRRNGASRMHDALALSSVRLEACFVASRLGLWTFGLFISYLPTDRASAPWKPIPLRVRSGYALWPPTLFRERPVRSHRPSTRPFRLRNGTRRGRNTR